MPPSVLPSSPSSRQFKLYDEGGLLVIVKPSGGKLWRLKYRYLGKEQTLCLGSRYPTVALKEARRWRGTKLASKLQAAKIRLLEKKRAAAAASVVAANTFLGHSRGTDCQASKGSAWKQITTGKVLWLLSLLEVELGRRPIAEIEPFELLAVLKKIETSGRLETS